MAANFLYALNQFLHNLLVAAFVGGSLFMVLVLRRHRDGQGLGLLHENLEGLVHRQAQRGFWTLAALMATGANFAVLSLSFYGKLPDLSPIAWGALAMKIILASICLGLLWHLWKGIGPRIEHISLGQRIEGELRLGESEGFTRLCMQRRILWQLLLVLGTLTLFSAALLRYMS